MAVEKWYQWRFYDKSGNIVAEGQSSKRADGGDFHLNDDGNYENRETGELRSGDVEYVDDNGNPVEPPVKYGLDGSIVIENNGGKNKGNKRAFGEIRSSLGTGISPAFKDANTQDVSRIEHPNQPQTPQTGSGNINPANTLIGQISQQNDILRNFSVKISRDLKGLSKISDGLKKVSDSIKSSAGQISANMTTNLSKVTQELNLSRQGQTNVSRSILALNGNLGSMSDNLAQLKENGKSMLDIEKERHTYEKTPQNIKDLDGETVANLSPRDAQTVKDITQAKMATDTNNFELSESDIEGLFGDLPDITGLFNVPHSSSVDLEYTK